MERFITILAYLLIGAALAVSILISYGLLSGLFGLMRMIGGAQ